MIEHACESCLLLIVNHFVVFGHWKQNRYDVI